jgi:hypothetical protein
MLISEEADGCKLKELSLESDRRTDILEFSRLSTFPFRIKVLGSRCAEPCLVDITGLCSYLSLKADKILVSTEGGAPLDLRCYCDFACFGCINRLYLPSESNEDWGFTTFNYSFTRLAIVGGLFILSIFRMRFSFC